MLLTRLLLLADASADSGAGRLYAPGPNGVADATFDRLAEGSTVTVGVDTANLRARPDVGAPVITRLALGTEVTVVEAAGDPVVVQGRRDVWYAVRVRGGPEGFVFGAILTTATGHDPLPGGGEVTWAVSFAPDFSPRVTASFALCPSREGTPPCPPPSAPVTLDLRVTDRFVGGRLSVTLEPWDTWPGPPSRGSKLVVTQCPASAAEGCVPVAVTIDRPGLLRQASPRDETRFFPARPWACDGPVVPVASSAPERLLTIVFPHADGGGPRDTTCEAIGAMPAGRIASCPLTVPSQDEMPAAEEVFRFVVGTDRWTWLPCASEGRIGHLATMLGDAGVTVDLDGAMRLALPAP